MEHGIKISELAKEHGISTRTLRFYEEESLLFSVPRLGNKERVYDEENARRVNKILKLRELDIPVSKIKDYFDRKISLEEILSEQEKFLESNLNFIYARQQKLRSFWERLEKEEDVWKEVVEKDFVEDEENRQLSRAILDEFFQDKFDLFFEHTTERMNHFLNKEALRGGWRQTIDGLGECKKIREVFRVIPGCTFILEFESIHICVRFVFGEKKICGFWLDYEENGVRKGMKAGL